MSKIFKAFVVAALAFGCGGGGDTLSPCGEYKACPGVTGTAAKTARESVQMFKESAASIDTAIRWSGAVTSRNIGRDGKPTSMALSFHSVTMSAPPDELYLFSTEGGSCIAEHDCQPGLPVDLEPAFPAIDSDQAIQAAFPSDPAGTTYAMVLNIRAFSYWTVMRESDSTAVKVDATTGAVVP